MPEQPSFTCGHQWLGSNLRLLPHPLNAGFLIDLDYAADMVPNLPNHVI
jgi:hypothetical protein